MRIVRVRYMGKAFYASLQDGFVTGLSRNDIYGELPLEEVERLPLVAPSKVVCMGLNYRGHAEELNMRQPVEPSFFLKPPSSIVEHRQPILIPDHVGRVDYEGELAVVMGQRCHRVSPDNARSFVFGFACANDVTARDLQKNETMFGRCKGFDTFCPLGPWIETEEPPASAKVRTLVNGEVRQEGKLSDMFFSPMELVSHVSMVMTLLPGDVILTGTPRGVGPIVPDDTVQVDIDHVGQLSNPVQYWGLYQKDTVGPMQ